MHVSETGQNQPMQRSHRRFIAAGASAVVMLGSANGVLAEGVSTSKQFSEETTPNSWVKKQGAHSAATFSTGEQPRVDQYEVLNSQSAHQFMAQTVEDDLDPGLQAMLDELMESAKALAQETEIPLRTDDEVEAGELPSDISIPELSVPIPEFAQAGEENVLDEQLVQSDPQDEPDIELTDEQEDALDEEDTSDEDDTIDEEATLDEDLAPDEGDSPVEEPVLDQNVSTEAEALLAPAPEYLESNPNPLYFPTNPGEVEIVGNQPITLEQALQLARQNSRDLQTAVLNYEGARADLRQQRAARLPTLSIGSNLIHTDLNPALVPTTTNPLTGETVEVEQDNNTTTLDGNVTISYDLFTSGSRNASIRAAERAVRLQELQIEVVTEDIRQDVTTAYYDLQEADETIRIAQADLEESLQSLRDAEARERAGVGTRFDRLQSEVDVANSQQDLRIAISNQQIARRALADLLSLPSGVDLSAPHDVEVPVIWP